MSAARLPPATQPLTADDVRHGRVAHRHAQLAAEHGSVFANVIPTGWPTGACVVIAGHQALAEATGAARAAFSSEKGWAPLLGSRFGRAVVNADEPQHAQDRRRWVGAFTPAELERSLAAVRRLVALRAQRWSAATDGFEPYPVTRELAFAAVATALGGLADDALLARVLWLLSAVLDPAEAGESELDRHHRVMPLRDELEALLRSHLAQLRADDAMGSSLLHHLLRQASPPSPAALLAHLNLLLLTGMETTASLLAWVMHYASMQPWRSWLREELMACAEAPDESPLATLDGLPRLDAFVREAGRLHTPVVAAPRACVSDVVVDGTRVPEGSLVVMSYGGANLLASHYPSPDEFRPQRWLDTGNAPPRPATFSSGHRLCIGMRFAQLEVKSVLAHVLTRYELSGGDGGLPVNAGFWNARATRAPHLTLRRRGGS